MGDHLFLPKVTDSRYPYTEDVEMNHEHDTPYPEVWSSFGAMAAVTTRLRFVASVYVLTLRSPIEVAKATSTLALISNNRVALGFGVGCSGLVSGVRRILCYTYVQHRPKISRRIRDRCVEPRGDRPVPSRPPVAA
jgi:hypothetical protein